MARFYYLENSNRVYIKEVDAVNATIDFTRDVNEAKRFRDGCFYEAAELDFIKTHFSKLYPQIKMLKSS